MTHRTAFIPYTLHTPRRQSSVSHWLQVRIQSCPLANKAQQDFLLTSRFNRKNKIVTMKGLKTDGILNITSFFLVIFLLSTLGLIINSLNYSLPPSSSLISLLLYPFLLSASPLMACLPFFQYALKMMSTDGIRVDAHPHTVLETDCRARCP